jgi:hypothetical protein
MLYLPVSRTKILLFLLTGLILFHVCFLSAKSFTAKSGSFKIINANEEQYQNYLNSIYDVDDKLSFISNTKTTYLFNLSEQFFLFFYVGYFLIAAILIFSAKTTSNGSDN